MHIQGDQIFFKGGANAPLPLQKRILDMFVTVLLFLHAWDQENTGILRCMHTYLLLVAILIPSPQDLWHSQFHIRQWMWKLLEVVVWDRQALKWLPHGK